MTLKKFAFSQIENKRDTLIKTTSNIVSYFVLIGIGFVYLYPILYMISLSIMHSKDLINPIIKWVPTTITLENFKLVYRVLDYSKSLLTTLLISTVCSALQTIVCALTGYALARYSVPAKKVWILILLILFIIPSDVVLVPRYVLFNQYHLIGRMSSMFLPAFIGQGLKSSLFILLFMQSFSSYPRSYDEAARLDGASNIRLFLNVGLPLSIPIIVLTVLFTFIWYWNETSQLNLFLSGAYKTLPLQLEVFNSVFSSMMQSAGRGNRLNEAIQMAATILVISPLVFLYFFVQKGLISSIESAGITGE